MPLFRVFRLQNNELKIMDNAINELIILACVNLLNEPVI